MMRRLTRSLLALIAVVAAVCAGVGAGEAATRVQAWSANLDSYSAVTPSSFVLDMLDEVDAAAVRAKLGLTDSAIQDQWVILASNATNASVTPTLATGMTFTPDANETYLVRVFCAFTSANTGTGVTFGLRDHATASDGWGAGYFTARAASATTTGSAWPSIATGAAGTDASGGSAGTGETMFRGELIWTSDASPTAVGVYFASEATDLITLLAGKCALSYREISTL
jgi:hypothetical protein